MAKDFATGAATMGRSADRLGMPVDKLSQFGIAAHLAGSSAEAMQAGLQGLQATTADAAYGRNNEAWQAFRAAGIDVGDAKRGVIDDPGRMAKIADETQRLAKVSTNAAQRWLDMVGVGRELYPVLRNGSAGLQGYMDQAQKLSPHHTAGRSGGSPARAGHRRSSTNGSAALRVSAAQRSRRA